MIYQLCAAFIGVAIMVTPAVLELRSEAANVFWVLGPIASSVALIAAFEVVRGVRFANIATGLGLVAAAVVAGLPAPAAVVAAIGGIALIACSIPEGRTKQSYGDGWRGVV